MVEDATTDTQDAGEEAPVGDVVLDNRYHILVGSRLPDLDMGGAKALAVRDDRMVAVAITFSSSRGAPKWVGRASR